MSTTVGELLAIISADMSGFAKSFAQAFGLIEQFGTKLHALGKDAVESANDFQEFSDQLEYTFKENAGAVDDWAKTSATAFQQTHARVRELAEGFGGAFRAAGVGMDHAVEMSKTLTAVAVDMSALFKDTSPEAAAQALRAAIMGSDRALRQFHVTIKDGALEDFGKSIGIDAATQKNLDEAGNQLLRYRYIMEQLKDVQGAMDRSTGSYGAQLRELDRAFAEQQKVIGEQLLPYYVKLYEQLNKFTSLLPTMIRGLISAAGFMHALVAGAAAFAGSFAGGLNTSGAGASDAKAAFKEAWGSTRGMYDKMADDAAALASASGGGPGQAVVPAGTVTGRDIRSRTRAGTGGKAVTSIGLELDTSVGEAEAAGLRVVGAFFRELADKQGKEYAEAVERSVEALKELNGQLEGFKKNAPGWTRFSTGTPSGGFSSTMEGGNLSYTSDYTQRWRAARSAKSAANREAYASNMLSAGQSGDVLGMAQTGLMANFQEMVPVVGMVINAFKGLISASMDFMSTLLGAFGGSAVIGLGEGSGLGRAGKAAAAAGGGVLAAAGGVTAATAFMGPAAPMMGASAAIWAPVAAAAAAFQELSMQTKSYAKLQALMGKISGEVANALEPFWRQLLPAGGVLFKFVQGLILAAQALFPLPEAGSSFFNAMKMFASNTLGVIITLMEAQNKLRRAFGWDEMDTTELRNKRREIDSLTVDASREFVDGLLSATDALREFTTALPIGYRINNARYQAGNGRDASSPRTTSGSSAPGDASAWDQIAQFGRERNNPFSDPYWG